MHRTRRVSACTSQQRDSTLPRTAETGLGGRMGCLSTRLFDADAAKSKFQFRRIPTANFGQHMPHTPTYFWIFSSTEFPLFRVRRSTAIARMSSCVLGKVRSINPCPPREDRAAYTLLVTRCFRTSVLVLPFQVPLLRSPSRGVAPSCGRPILSLCESPAATA